MPPKRNYRRRPSKFVTAAPWNSSMGSGFYPGYITPDQQMSAYMQAALGFHGAGGMFGVGRSRRRDYLDDYDFCYDYDYDYEDMRNPYFRINNKRFDNRDFRGRNKRFRRNTGPNNRGGTSARKPRTNDRPGSTAEQEGNGTEAAQGSSQGESSGQGAKAPSRDWKNARDSQTHYCTVCEKKFVGSFFSHKRDLKHRRNKDKKYPRCRLCRMAFSGVDEFDAHNESEEHKKMNEDFQVLKKQQQVHAALSDSEDGQQSLQRYINAQEPDNVLEDEEAVGLFHIVPMKVFFCKLCQKLFPNYMRGRHVHCRTPAHIQAYKVYFDGKEERAAERNRLNQEQKKGRALRRARLQMEKSAKEGAEKDGATEEMAIDEEVSSNDEKQDEENKLTEDEDQLLAEDEQAENAEEANFYEDDFATNQDQDWQEEGNNENIIDA